MIAPSRVGLGAELLAPNRRFIVADMAVKGGVGGVVAARSLRFGLDDTCGFRRQLRKARKVFPVGACSYSEIVLVTGSDRWN